MVGVLVVGFCDSCEWRGRSGDISLGFSGALNSVGDKTDLTPVLKSCQVIPFTPELNRQVMYSTVNPLFSNTNRPWG